MSFCYRFSVLLAVAFVFSSCALTKETVTLAYTPQQGASPIPGASKKVIQVLVQDDRADQSKISCKKNGYGMEMAPIYSDVAVATVFKSAIEAELKNRGFRVGQGKGLNVVVDRFYNDFKIGLWAGDAVGELEMQVTVGSYRRPIKTSFQHSVQIAGGANAKQALDGAMQNALQKLFADPAFISALLH